MRKIPVAGKGAATAEKYCSLRRHPVVPAVIFLVAVAPAFARDSASSLAKFEATQRALQAAIARKDIAPDVVDVPPPPQLQIQKVLGEQLFSDKNLSRLRNQSCASCHDLTPAANPKTGLPYPAPGFVDSDNVERGTPVSDGSIAGRFGKLNAPSVGYAMFSPAFHFDPAEGLYVGGQFWNGRASTLADQAAQPLLNPAEMAMPSKESVVARVRQSGLYRFLFGLAFRIDIYQATTTPEINAAYDAMTQAIAAFERKPRFARFTSKFDYFVAGRTRLTAQERLGLELFNGKALCSACHISTPTQNAKGKWIPALFTDFTYDNIGAPRNTNIPGDPPPDKGLGGRPDIAAKDPGGLEIGKHKVMSLRNIAITPPYGHNGVFRSLEQITHFYNTRDTLGRVPGNRDPGFGVTGWPVPEVAQNVNTDELGNLGLTGREEAAIVAFMKTLTDGYPYWGNDPVVPPGSAPPYAN